MAKTYKQAIATQTPKTSQAAPIPGRETEMVQTTAGGFAFEITPFQQLERFLILGTEGGTYYASEKKHTEKAIACLPKCIELDGRRTVDLIVNISKSGRAPKNDPAVLALALVASYPQDKMKKVREIYAEVWRLSHEIKKRALTEAEKAALTQLKAEGKLIDRELARYRPTQAYALDCWLDVCRFGTDQLHFADYLKELRGFGRHVTASLAKAFTGDAYGVIRNVTKYQQRDGWSQNGLLQQAHPVPPTNTHNAIFKWITNGSMPAGAVPVDVSSDDKALNFLWAYEEAKKRAAVKDVRGVCDLIAMYRLEREHLPTEMLTERSVWETLLLNLKPHALLRNLSKLSAIGLLTDGNFNIVNHVTGILTDEELIKRQRVHPFAILAALTAYRLGHGIKGNLTWTPSQKVLAALDAAYYLAFPHVEPTNKRRGLYIDISGSMESGTIAGIPGMTPRMAAAALAMLVIRTEPNYIVKGFCTSGTGWSYGNDVLIEIPINKTTTLQSAMDTMAQMNMGGTDLALPFVSALRDKQALDSVEVYTDNEVYLRRGEQPSVMLKRYRKEMSIYTKFVVNAMTVTNFSVADPADLGSLDVVGLDTATPQLVADFIK